MKKLISLLLVIAMLCALSSCALIRKATPTGETADISVNETKEEETNNTEFKESEETTADEEVDFDEDDAYNTLYESLSAQNPDSDIKVEKTGDVTAQSTGNEYYILKATITPKASEEDTDKDSKETKETEKAEPVTATYYVSTTGTVFESLEEDTITVKEAAESYTKKNGTKDSETGFEYDVAYAGLVKNNGIVCYNFVISLKETTDGTEKLVYKVNYLVSLDGKSSGSQALEQK